MAGTVSSKLATIIVVIPLLVLIWFLAPLALPVWRWRNMDFQELAAKTKISAKELQIEYKVTARYQPRGENDPCPWQVCMMDPAWSSTSEQHQDEDKLLVRCSFVSDRDGSGPSKLFLGSGGPAGFKDHYWKADCWRFPAGTFGFNKYHPVVVYRADTLEKLDVTNSESLNTDIGGAFGGTKWTADDKDNEDPFKGH
jgi:hypothetical protein